MLAPACGLQIPLGPRVPDERLRAIFRPERRDDALEMELGQLAAFLQRHWVAERVNLAVELIEFFIPPASVLELLVGDFHDAAIGSLDLAAHRRTHSFFLLLVKNPSNGFRILRFFSVENPELTGLEYVVPTERKCLFDPKVTKR